jgi:acyl-homoserine lactone acylase PvdQ
MEEGPTKPAQGKTAINKASRLDVLNPLSTAIRTAQQQPRDTPKEFRVASTSAPRRLNDIAQEPPQFGKLPRGAQSSKDSSQAKVVGILSMAQKAMMEEERENVIKRYRELKAKRLRNDGSATGE